MATVHAPELLIVMSGNATPGQVEEVVARLEEVGAQAHVTPGRQATVIGAIGERELIASLPLGCSLYLSLPLTRVVSSPTVRRLRLLSHVQPKFPSTTRDGLLLFLVTCSP